MRAACCKATVLSHSAPAADIRLLRVLWPDPGHAPHAGQFFTLRSWGAEEAPFLSRPISVHKWEPETLTVSFLYQVVGQGTARLAALKEGDALQLTGPMGNGFDVPDIAARYEKIALVGGGIGVAPLLLLCRELAAAGCKPELYAGFRDAPYALEDFLPYCAAISVATDSGAVGYHGLVTGILHPEEFDLVLTCGPNVMMQGVYRLCAEKGVPCLASLERKMACGLGACLGCTCHTKVGPKTVCQDGPVFPAQEVFDLG